MKKNGFSLVELAVVLVIVGIIIGGIIVGKSMLGTARLQSVVSDWQKYSTAANSYFSKYNYWPGDDNERSTKWNSGWTNGNGDGTLGAANNDLEFMYFWQDLAQAGFITGTYNGAFSATTGTPKAQISGSWMTHYYDGTTNQQFYITGRSPTATVGYSGETSTYVLSATDALSIDTKIDDGLPLQQANNTGTVVAVGATTNGTSTTTCINGTGVATTDKYQSNTSAACNLYYIYKK